MGRPSIDLAQRDHANPKRFCQQCAKQLIRKRFSNNAPESEKLFHRRMFCDERCFADHERGRPQASTAVKLASGEMKCPRCGETKPFAEFPKKSGRKGVPRYGYCKPCHTVYQRTLTLKRLFNLTPDDYDRILSFQSGNCAVCGRPPKPGKHLAVDHNHSSGLTRGLLCWICNRTIGMFRDDTARIEKALDYLKHPPATLALGEARYGRPGKVSNKAATTKRLVRKINRHQHKE